MGGKVSSASLIKTNESRDLAAENADRRNGIDPGQIAASQKGGVPLPRQWVVERRFARTARFRRLARDLEKAPETLADLRFLAFVLLLLPNFVQTLARRLKFHNTF